MCGHSFLGAGHRSGRGGRGEGEEEGPGRQGDRREEAREDVGEERERGGRRRNRCMAAWGSVGGESSGEGALG